MPKIKIKGGVRLDGAIPIQGAKNSALPILAASFLTDAPCILHNCPRLSDVETSFSILRELGCEADWTGDGNTARINAAHAEGWAITDELMREMRSSIIFLGAVVGKTGRARLSYPGGCELGPRPIDFHLSALKQMGVTIEEEHGYISCMAKERLRGAHITLAFPSVGATENVLIAASVADGNTVLENAAGEPEICDLADFLNRCGAHIHGAGSSRILIEGVGRLNGAEHSIIPDRIVASTYLSAAAATQGRLTLQNIIPAHLSPVLPAFREAGCDLRISGRELTISAPPRLSRVSAVRTMPYPGFPTDAAAPLLSAVTQSNGTSMFVENIFSNRYKYTGELTRMGASIKVEERVAVVEGVQRLYGANVEAADLRGGAALVVAGLAAEGVTMIGGTQYIDRGYECMEQYLSSAGALVQRVREEKRETFSTINREANTEPPAFYARGSA